MIDRWRGEVLGGRRSEQSSSSHFPRVHWLCLLRERSLEGLGACGECSEGNVDVVVRDVRGSLQRLCSERVNAGASEGTLHLGPRGLTRVEVEDDRSTVGNDLMQSGRIAAEFGDVGDAIARTSEPRLVTASDDLGHRVAALARVGTKWVSWITSACVSVLRSR
jgi:hypothetical protein